MRGNKILILNGPNINCLEYRESCYPNTYTYNQLQDYINTKFANLIWYQSNYEGELISAIQKVIDDESIGGLVINPGGYTHYSISILDALLLLDIPKVEVHMSDITKREAYRNFSITKNGVDQIFMGDGIDSYIKAIQWLNSQINNNKKK